MYTTLLNLWRLCQLFEILLSNSTVAFTLFMTASCELCKQTHQTDPSIDVIITIKSTLYDTLESIKCL